MKISIKMLSAELAFLFGVSLFVATPRMVAASPPFDELVDEARVAVANRDLPSALRALERASMCDVLPYAKQAETKSVSSLLDASRTLEAVTAAQGAGDHSEAWYLVRKAVGCVIELSFPENDVPYVQLTNGLIPPAKVCRSICSQQRWQRRVGCFLLGGWASCYQSADSRYSTCVGRCR